MIFDGRLAVTFLEIIFFLSITGWSYAVWFRRSSTVLYPAFGLLVFGALSVPASYVYGHFSTTLILVVSLLPVVAALVVKRRTLFRFSLAQPKLSTVFFVLALGLIALLGIIQASKYGIPGGVDSAVHSNIINSVLIQAGTLKGAYPLGFHVLVLFFERFLHATQPNVFLSLYIVFHLMTIAGLAVIVERLSDRRFAVIAALAAGCIDVSTFNNLLNGSGTHLLGAALIPLLVVVAMFSSSDSPMRRWIFLSLSFTALWYFHYPSLFFAILSLWAFRVATQQARSWVYVASFATGAVLSIPMQQYQFADPTYIHSILPGLGAALLAEVLWYFGDRYVLAMLRQRYFQLGISAAGLLLFLFHLNSFLYLPTWYGMMLVSLAIVGLIFSFVLSTSLGVLSRYSFVGISILFALVSTSWAPGQSKVMTELIYYFGYTFSLVLLATNALLSLLTIIRISSFQKIASSILLFYCILILLSRGFDITLVHAAQNRDQPLSRYGASKGFSILYSKNDVALAEWITTHVPNDGVLYNPGGLYNAYAPLTEHPIAFSTYNVPTIPDFPTLLPHLIRLLEGSSNVSTKLLLSHNVRYILLPESYSVAVYNPNVRLLHQEGRARIYEITDTFQTGFLPIALQPGDISSSVSLTTTGYSDCRYCGDTFYFSDKKTLQQINLENANTIKLTLPAELAEGRYALFVDYDGGSLDVQRDGGSWQKSSQEMVLSDIAKIAGKSMVIMLRNSQAEENIRIFAMGLKKIQ